MTTPNKPTIIETPEQVESLVAGAPLNVTTGTTWPGGRGVSPVFNAMESLRKCSELMKAFEQAQQLQHSWQPCAEPSWSQMTMPDIPEMLREARAMIKSKCGEGTFPFDSIAIRRADYERVSSDSAWRYHLDKAALENGSIYGATVHVFETAEECIEFCKTQYILCGRYVLHFTINEEEPKLPFELGKTKITIAKPADYHQRFNCYPVRVEDGKLICCIQNDHSGWWEDWNIEHTISGIKSGFYKVEKTGETIGDV